jgi:chemotaxis protein MotB
LANGGAEIRIVKRRRGHAAHHGGAWKVAFADFMTAMMAFFLVMWICGMSKDVKAAVAAYFKDPIAFNEAVKAGNAPFAVSPGSVGSGGNPPTPSPGEAASLKKTMASIQKIVANTPEFKNLSKYVDVKMVSEGLLIELVEAKESLFFDSGSAKVKTTTQHLLTRIAHELGKLPNKIIVEGHTDNRPLARHDNYTNWELSADRANGARRIMEQAGMSDSQIAQVRGYASTQPRDPSDPSRFTNRRVSIIVEMGTGMPPGALNLSLNDETKGVATVTSPTNSPHSATKPREKIDIGIPSFGPGGKH